AKDNMKVLQPFPNRLQFISMSFGTYFKYSRDDKKFSAQGTSSKSDKIHLDEKTNGLIVVLS
ncbi:MAG: hypothetical protein AB2705_22895, partial [Candidatus Thiodiazotropha sp.]